MGLRKAFTSTFSIPEMPVFFFNAYGKKLGKQAENWYTAYMENVQNRLESIKQRKGVHKQYLHSPAHLLADELSKLFSDPKHFAAYLKLALTHNPDQLRKIAQEVFEGKNVKNPAKLFMYLVKKSKEQSPT